MRPAETCSCRGYRWQSPLNNVAKVQVGHDSIQNATADIPTDHIIQVHNEPFELSGSARDARQLSAFVSCCNNPVRYRRSAAVSSRPAKGADFRVCFIMPAYSVSVPLIVCSDLLPGSASGRLEGADVQEVSLSTVAAEVVPSSACSRLRTAHSASSSMCASTSCSGSCAAASKTPAACVRGASGLRERFVRFCK